MKSIRIMDSSLHLLCNLEDGMKIFIDNFLFTVQYINAFKFYLINEFGHKVIYHSVDFGEHIKSGKIQVHVC